jgi:uncharacterized protein (DUF697 family)
MPKSSEEKADAVIAGLVSTAVAAAVIPVPLTVPFIGLVASGVVAIGACYGVKLSKEEAWKLLREFFKAAGFTFMAINVGSVLLSAVMTVTGAGYVVGVALDAVQASAIAYAVGSAAKHYFAGEHSRAALGAVMRAAFTQQKERAIATLPGAGTRRPR